VKLNFHVKNLTTTMTSKRSLYGHRGRYSSEITANAANPGPGLDAESAQEDGYAENRPNAYPIDIPKYPGIRIMRKMQTAIVPVTLTQTPFVVALRQSIPSRKDAPWNAGGANCWTTPGLPLIMYPEPGFHRTTVIFKRVLV